MSARNNTSVQSLTRGVAVLRALAEGGAMTATEIAQSLGLHQSSASRLLRSLEIGGFVRKPDFHSFALDYGVLLFAGVAMEHFDEVRASVEVCTRVHRQTGFGTACTVMHRRRLIYLAHVHPGGGDSLVLVDNSSFPIYLSAPGLLLSYLQGKREMLQILKESMRRHPPEGKPTRPEEIHAIVDASVRKHGFLFLGAGIWPAGCRASRAFDTDRGIAAFTLYTTARRLAFERVSTIMDEAVSALERRAARRPRRRTG